MKISNEKIFVRKKDSNAESKSKTPGGEPVHHS